MTMEISNKMSNILKMPHQRTQTLTSITWTGEYKNDIFVCFKTLYFICYKI